MIKFKILKAEDYCDSVRDGTHDSPQKTDSGYKLITSKHIKEYGLDLDSAYCISEKDFNKVNERSAVNINDILYSMIGTIGLMYRVKSQPNYAIKNMGLFKISDEIKSKWLYYYLKSPKMQDYIKSLLNGSTQQYITLSNLRQIPIEMPENEGDMKKIIKVLDLIDKKIQINTKTNDNLQKIARNQFYELFANKKVNAKFKDLVNIKKKAIKASNKNTNLGYYPIDMLPMNYLVTQNCKSNEEANSSLIEFSKYDILLGSMRVYFHRVCLAADDGITRNTTFVFEPKQKELLYYALLLIDRNEFIDYANKTSKGSTMPYAVWEALSEYEIYLPENNEISDFSNLMYPLFEKMILNEKENRILEQLRDTLLPKLMNGEIDLDKIEN